jgi:hypothetical protein
LYTHLQALSQKRVGAIVATDAYHATSRPTLTKVRDLPLPFATQNPHFLRL